VRVCCRIGCSTRLLAHVLEKTAMTIAMRLFLNVACRRCHPCLEVGHHERERDALDSGGHAGLPDPAVLAMRAISS
jgi:hypothetical protein